MKGKEFIELVQSGAKPVIEFTKESWELEYDPDIGTRARATKATYDGNNVWEVSCDLSEFEEYNKQFETRHYFDKDNNPTLVWRETSYYPSNKIYTFYVCDDDNLIVKIVDDNKLYKEYLDLKTEVSYISWLEQELLKLRNQ